MRRRDFLKSTALFSLSTMLFNCQNTKKQSNIIFILADDLGYGDLGCYGQKTLKTPNIDNLAADGLLMTQFYTGSTVCAPSRATLMTGKHTGHNSVRSNADGLELLDNELTIAKLLKQSGYKTGCIGKWGVGTPSDKNDPEKRGFDYFYGFVCMGHAHNYFPEFLYRNGEKVYLKNKLRLNEDGSNPLSHKPEGMGVAEVKNEYAPFNFDREAINFIEENKNNPFFLYLPYTYPHANNQATENGSEVPDYGEWADKDWPDVEKGFAQMVTLLDNSVGMIMNKVKELGLEENTLIIFCSDNGPHEEAGHKMEFFNSNGDLRGMKRDLYEGGIRTPFIAKWKGEIKPSTTSHHQAAFWDVLPTLSDLACVDYPEGIDGISFLPTLLHKGKQAVHEYLYWEFYAKGGKQAVIKGDWKAVRLNLNNSKPIEEELYNLKHDPKEKQNVINEYPDSYSKIKPLFSSARDNNYRQPLIVK